MKRLRDEEDDEKEDKNHFLNSVIDVPVILWHIFDSLTVPQDLLHLFRLLWFHLRNHNNVLYAMEVYLTSDPENTRPSLIKGMKIISDHRLDKIMDALKNAFIPSNPKLYVKNLDNYLRYRHVRTFITYGICGECESFESSKWGAAYLFQNWSKTELETRYIYACNLCLSKELCYSLGQFPKQLAREIYDDPPKTQKELKRMGKELIYKFFAQQHGLRYGFSEDKRWVVYGEDVKNVRLRAKLLNRVFIIDNDK